MIIPGQAVRASTDNNALMSRLADTSTVGKVALQNPGSDSITDAQAYINKLGETVGTTETDLTNLDYSSNDVVANGDSHKVAIGKLDAFSGDLRTDLDALDSREASNNSIQAGQITALDGRVNTIESLDSTFGGIKTFSNDVIIQGDLEVQGALTAINSTELEIQDAFITINKGGSDATSEGAGIEIERTSDNAGIVFDSSLLSKFKLGLVTAYSEVLVAAFDQVVTGIKDFVNGLKTDVVSESTTDAGVTVDGVLIKDGLIDGRDVSADGSALDSLGGSFSGHIGDASIHFTESSISHLNIQDIGTNSHAQIDTHIAATNNPHAVTKDQVGLTNVTDDAQLKRAAGDFNTFTAKATPVNADLVLIEDSEDGFTKKKVALADIGIGGGGVQPPSSFVYNNLTANATLAFNLDAVHNIIIAQGQNAGTTVLNAQLFGTTAPTYNGATITVISSSDTNRIAIPFGGNIVKGVYTNGDQITQILHFCESITFTFHSALDRWVETGRNF
jgi:hypothetical protein